MHNWFPVEWSDQIKTRPHGVSLKGVPIVLFRSGGKIRALADRCPHRGAPLSQGSLHEGRLVCPYHGWRFEGDGTCNLVPGLKCYSSKEGHRTQAYQAEEKYGLVWVCLDPHAKCTIPEILIGTKEKKFHLTMQINSSLKDIVENALDPLHTHFVHGGWIRSDAQ
ncbi:MAG TPA: Rieske (2Fe-2S) protein, partial [Rhabdochlamydiaceae bacterium]